MKLQLWMFLLCLLIGAGMGISVAIVISLSFLEIALPAWLVYGLWVIAVKAILVSGLLGCILAVTILLAK